MIEATEGAVRLPIQARSQKTYTRLMETAEAMMREQDFAAISVRELAQRASCAVGSFYHRFGTKYGLLSALVAQMMEKRSESANHMFATTSTTNLPEAMARGALINYRENANLLRTAMRYHLDGKDSWTPITIFGKSISERYYARLEADRGAPLSDDERRRLDFVSIWLHGHLTNSLVYVYPVHNLEEEIFEEETVRHFALAVQNALVPQTV